MVDYRINYGQDFNYFKKVTVSNATFGSPTDGYRYDVLIPFSTQAVTFLNEATGAGKIIEYSFDGFNVHGEIDPQLPNRYSTFQNRTVCKVWFRVKSGSTGPITIAVEAWAIR